MVEGKRVKTIELETARLKLRQWKKEDYEAFAKLNADPKVMEYFPNPLTQTQSNEMATKIETLMKKKGWGFWAVEVKSSGKFIGYVGLHEPSHALPFTPCVEIAWRLSKESWGKGYATEAAKEALRFGFETLALDEILSFTAVINQPSRAVMERLGMRYCTEADFEHPAVAVGSTLREHVVYRLMSKEFFQ